MKLIPLWQADLTAAYALHNTFPAQENGFDNAAWGLDFDGFCAYVERRKNWNQGIGLPEDFVPDTVFILEDAGHYVGIFYLRHRLNESLANGAGHIGYGISPAFRRQGYATAGLALVLNEARAIGIQQAYLSVNQDNVGSLKAQLANGARIHHQNEQEYFTRISL